MKGPQRPITKYWEGFCLLFCLFKKLQFQSELISTDLSHTETSLSPAPHGRLGIAQRGWFPCQEPTSDPAAVPV